MSTVLAGPTAGSFFAELGAKVIKVERKSRGGDSTRGWKSQNEDADIAVSAYYAAANTNKDVIFLNLDEEEDYTTFLDLLSKADIVISNFQKRVAEKLKVSYLDLKARKSDIIMAQLSAYGYDDPRPGYDMVMQAETGWVSMTGTDKNHLAKLPVALIDILASHQIREGILLALMNKLKTGKGAEIPVSLFDASLSALANQGSNYLMNKIVPQPIGTRHPNIAPYGDIFITNDGESIILAVGNDAQFKNLGETLNFSEEILTKFKFNRQRVEFREDLIGCIQLIIGQSNLESLEKKLIDAIVPFCRLKTIQDVLDSPEASSMIIYEIIDGIVTTKTKQVAFSIK